MKRIISACLFALLTACAAPEPEEAMTVDAAPSAGKVAEADMLAEPVMSPETCDNSGDGIGGIGCPID